VVVLAEHRLELQHAALEVARRELVADVEAERPELAPVLVRVRVRVSVRGRVRVRVRVRVRRSCRVRVRVRVRRSCRVRVRVRVRVLRSCSSAWKKQMAKRHFLKASGLGVLVSR